MIVDVHSSMSSFTLSSAVSGMFRPGLLRFSAVLAIITFLTLSQIEVSSARSMGLSDDYWSTADDLNKRNSWWSKKSLESAPDYTTFTGPAYKEPSLDLTADSSAVDISSSLYGCYTESCLPEFLNCAALSRSYKSLGRCRVTHRICASSCLVDVREGRSLV